MSIRSIITRLLRDKSGATAIEYGLIIGVISMAIISAANALLGASGSLWQYIQDHLDLVF